MEKSIKIGPIKRRKSVKTVHVEVRKQINKMKLGEYFEISGVDKKNLLNLRAAVSYFSKKDGYRVATEHTGDTLTIERIRK
jgi:hypothetical protein